MSEKNLARLYQQEHIMIIWGHGLKYINEIIEILEANPNFIIRSFTKKKIVNMSKFIRKVYHHDYAPYHHLKSKTRYLSKVEKKVMFISFSNLSNDYDFVDIGRFRHLESASIRSMKNKIRGHFNPKNSIENHVVHVTDYHNQTKMLLHLFPDVALNEDCHFHKSLISKFGSIKLINLSIDFADISLNRYKHPFNGELIDTPHFKFIDGNKEYYKSYLSENLGLKLRNYYSESKFMRQVMQYHTQQSLNGFIVLRNDKSKFWVVDGMHRLSILKSNGVKSYPFMVLYD